MMELNTLECTLQWCINEASVPCIDVVRGYKSLNSVCFPKDILRTSAGQKGRKRGEVVWKNATKGCALAGSLSKLPHSGAVTALQLCPGMQHVLLSRCCIRMLSGCCQDVLSGCCQVVVRMCCCQPVLLSGYCQVVVSGCCQVVVRLLSGCCQDVISLLSGCVVPRYAGMQDVLLSTGLDGRVHLWGPASQELLLLEPFDVGVTSGAWAVHNPAVFVVRTVLRPAKHYS